MDLKALLKDMSPEEKAAQLVQLSSFLLGNDGEILTGPLSELGVAPEDMMKVGSILGADTARQIVDLQDKAMAAQPHHIPMMFMLDVIHGFRTVFPAPIGLGATFDPELAGECAAVAAKEASAAGVQVAFSPMVDLCRDARWGRVMESPGEDPYLNGLFAAAQVHGMQGDDMGAKGKVCACIKHFAGYGAAESGREYNTVELSETAFRNYYLKSYEAGVKAGAGMVMTSFNTINGVAASVNKKLMRGILRDEMGFDGILISDFSAIKETIAHGCSEDARDAARKALIAGVDIDMMTDCYARHAADLVRSGELDEAVLDEAVLRVLELKQKLGLFENPYKDADPEHAEELMVCAEHRALARKAAAEACTVLKNDGILPVSDGEKVLIAGPYTDCKELVSSWALAGRTDETVSVAEAMAAAGRTARLIHGYPMLDNSDVVLTMAGAIPHHFEETEAAAKRAEIVAAAAKADKVILLLGEHYGQTGEATSRTRLQLPEVQMQLVREVCAVNKNVAAVIFCGRPLDITELDSLVSAVMIAWLPGTEGGNAVADVLYGAAEPSGHLSMSFPRTVGQCPIYYNRLNTGRPRVGDEKFVSRYTDEVNEPLYPFGHGLGYAKFRIDPVELSSAEITADGTVTAKAKITNVSDRAGTAVAQLYIRDISASIARPVRELKGIARLTLQPGESGEAVFTIGKDQLSFINEDAETVVEPGAFTVWIGDSSDTRNAAALKVKA